MIMDAASIRDYYQRVNLGTDLDGPRLMAEFDALKSASRVRRAASLVADARGSFIDVGCGSGGLLYLLRDQFDAMHGLDFAAAQLAKARTWASQANASIAWHHVDLDRDGLPLPASSLDAAAALVLFELVVSPARALAEIHRVLRPEGIFVTSVGNVVSWRNRCRVLAGLDPRTTALAAALNGGALHLFTKDTFVGLLTTAGFEIETVTCSGRWWQIRQWRPSLAAGDIMVRARKATR